MYFSVIIMFIRKTACPGDPNDYKLIHSKEGKYWRKKRGTIKPIEINDSLRKNVNLMSILSPAAARISSSLRPFFIGFKTGRLNVRIASCLRKSFKEKNEIQFSYLKGLEFQNDHPLDRMVLSKTVQSNDNIITIDIITGVNYIIPQNKVATDYYFEAILVYGDLNKEKALKTESVESQLYSFSNATKGKCILTLPKPKKNDWMVLLKISCLEGNQMAVHHKHYRMVVVDAKPKTS